MNLGTLFETAGENVQFLLVCAVVIAALALGSKLVERTILKDSIASVSSTRYITICGMLGALAMLLHIFDFPVAFIAPSFYKLDFSEIPVMIGAFMLGPVGGVIIELVKVLLKLVIKGTSTAFVGDLANFVVGCAFVVPASIVYHRKKTRTNAIVALVTGTLVMTVFGSAFNALYLIPAFASLYGMPIDVIIEMGTAINPAITSVWTFAIFAVAPLNLLKGVLISVPTMVLYKRISKVLHNTVHENYRAGKKSQPEM
jgi:riboflavin transporter FmnP